MFSRCKTARTPGVFPAVAVSSLTTRPLAMVASTGTAYSSPGKWKSEVYCAVPVTFCGPSTRGVSRPIGEVVGVSCGVGMVVPSLRGTDLQSVRPPDGLQIRPTESGCRRHVERVREAALGQLDLEPVLAL